MSKNDASLKVLVCLRAITLFQKKLRLAKYIDKLPTTFFVDYKYDIRFGRIAREKSKNRTKNRTIDTSENHNNS